MTERAKPSRHNPWYDEWVKEHQLRKELEADLEWYRRELAAARSKVQDAVDIFVAWNEKARKLQTEVDLLRAQLQEKVDG
jgi:malonyl CoA-acyl carrier protein transacylase